MRQEINLYQEPFVKRAVLWGAMRLAQCVIVWLVLLGVLSVGLLWHEARQGEALETSRRSVAHAQGAYEQARASLPEPLADPRLKAELARLEQELSAKQSFLTHFDDRSIGNSEGFSPVLRGLGRQRYSNLWLTRIEIAADGALSFAGSAQRPEAVPAFVSALTTQPIFHGRSFRTLRMEEQGPQLDFELRSREAQR